MEVVEMAQVASEEVDTTAFPETASVEPPKEQRPKKKGPEAHGIMKEAIVNVGPPVTVAGPSGSVGYAMSADEIRTQMFKLQDLLDAMPDDIARDAALRANKGCPGLKREEDRIITQKLALWKILSNMEEEAWAESRTSSRSSMGRSPTPPLRDSEQQEIRVIDRALESVDCPVNEKVVLLEEREALLNELARQDMSRPSSRASSVDAMSLSLEPIQEEGPPSPQVAVEEKRMIKEKEKKVNKKKKSGDSGGQLDWRRAFQTTSTSKK